MGGGRWRGAVAAAVLLLGCGGAQKADPGGTARAALLDLQQQAQANPRPIVAIAHSADVAAWDELELRVLSTPEGQTLLRDALVRRVDVDQPVGAALAAQLRILVVPTAVVLRVRDGQLVEMARVQGYTEPADWREQLVEALERQEPVLRACHNADDRRLDARTSPAVLVPDIGCAATNLFTSEHAPAAVKLHALLADPDFADLGTDWPEPERRGVADLLLLLGPYHERVRQDPRACADAVGRVLAWPGLPESRKPHATQWRATCLARAGQGGEALQVLEAWLGSQKVTPQTLGVVAEVMVRQRLAPERAAALLTDLVAVDPEDADAWLLLAELDERAGRREAAIEKLYRADRLRPQHARTLKALLRLRAVPAAVAPVTGRR